MNLKVGDKVLCPYAGNYSEGEIIKITKEKAWFFINEQIVFVKIRMGMINDIVKRNANCIYLCDKEELD